jgi:hypothetical protein
MASAVLNQQVQEEISRLARANRVDVQLLEEFAYFVIHHHRPKSPTSDKSLTLDKLKSAIYHRFNVKNTQELRKSGAFKMATDGLGVLNFRFKSTPKREIEKFFNESKGCTKVLLQGSDELQSLEMVDLSY